MLKAEEFAGPPETSLNLVEDQQGLMRIAPLPEFLNIFLGTETRAASLISLKEDACNVSGFNVETLQRRFKNLEASILGAKTIGIRYLYEARVMIDDPLFESWDTPHHLSSKGPAVETTIEGNNN